MQSSAGKDATEAAGGGDLQLDVLSNLERHVDRLSAFSDEEDEAELHNLYMVSIQRRLDFSCAWQLTGSKQQGTEAPEESTTGKPFLPSAIRSMGLGRKAELCYGSVWVPSGCSLPALASALQTVCRCRCLIHHSALICLAGCQCDFCSAGSEQRRRSVGLGDHRGRGCCEAPRILQPLCLQGAPHLLQLGCAQRFQSPQPSLYAHLISSSHSTVCHIRLQ